MSSQNLQVMEFVVDRLDAGEFVWLVTLTGIWGSAPRRPGSLLGVSRDAACGSLSGGCLEEGLLTRLRNGEFSDAHPHRLGIGVSQEQARQFRLPCGGQMDLLLEPLHPGSASHHACAGVREALRARHAVTRRLHARSGEEHLTTLPGSLAAHTPPTWQGEWLTHSLGPQARLLIVGANMVAEHLAALADSLEMEVWVCDPRPDAFAQWPHAFTRNSSAFPDDLVREHFQDPASLIVTLAHDPRVDDMALMEALTSPAAWVGALGSRQTTEARRRRLLDLGVPADALARLRAPVGLDLRSKTPVEIAIAIAAELIALRNGGARATSPSAHGPATDA